MNDEQKSAQTQDHSTELAEERTDLALKRTVIAEERTLMAWVRTSISMISFGFTIYKFFEYLVASEGKKLRGLLGPQELALILITLGTLMLFFAIIQHWQFIDSLDLTKPRRWSLAVIVALLTVLIGIWAFLHVIMS